MSTFRIAGNPRVSLDPIAPMLAAFDAHSFEQRHPAHNTSVPEGTPGLSAKKIWNDIVNGPEKHYVAKVLQTPALPPTLSPSTQKALESVVHPYLAGSVIGLGQSLKESVDPASGFGLFRFMHYANGALNKNYDKTWAGSAQKARDVTAGIAPFISYVAVSYFLGVRAGIAYPLAFSYLPDFAHWLRSLTSEPSATERAKLGGHPY